MFGIKPTIDVSANNEYAFKNACENGHLEVVKWLLSIKPDINIEEETFYNSCSYGFLSVAKFLWRIKPESFNICHDLFESVAYFSNVFTSNSSGKSRHP